MWIVLALGSALFSGITTILAKIGLKNIDSTVATAVRTIVVLLFSWLMVFIVGSQSTLPSISAVSLIFLILSGLATGASWLCYFKALQTGDVSKVAPIDKSSMLLTMVLAVLFLGEPLTFIKLLGMITIMAGTYLMIAKKPIKGHKSPDKKSLIYAAFSAIFASLTSILGKIGIQGVESNLGTAIRTIVVLIMAWIIVFRLKKQKEIRKLDKKNWVFLCLSGITTGLAWMCYYRALQDGPASVVVPIDKLSILLTVAFASLFLKEKITKTSLIGLCLIAAGTCAIILNV